MRNRVFGQMWTAKAQISPLTMSLNTIKCIHGEQMSGRDLAYVWDESEYCAFCANLKDTFSLGMDLL